MREYNEDEPFVFDVDQVLIDKVELAISCLELTEDYQGSTREEISGELLRALFEFWVECEYQALANLVDILQEHSHDHHVESDVGIIEEISVLHGSGYRETRRIVKYLKDYLRHEDNQIFFDRIYLPKSGRVISVTVCRERM